MTLSPRTSEPVRHAPMPPVEQNSGDANCSFVICLLKYLLTYLLTYCSRLLINTTVRSDSRSKHRDSTVVRPTKSALRLSTTRCLAVIGGGSSVGECGRLRQVSWLVGALMCFTFLLNVTCRPIRMAKAWVTLGVWEWGSCVSYYVTPDSNLVHFSTWSREICFYRETQLC